MSALILFRLIHKPLFVAAIAVLWVAIGLLCQAFGFSRESSGIERVSYALFVDNGSRLYVSFVLGILTYQLRDRIAYSWAIFAGCAALCLLLSTYAPGDAINHPVMNALATPIIVYMTMFLGTTAIPMPEFLRKGDYSYGIYLYGWPLQQVVVALAPQGFPLIGHFLAAMLLILMFSAFSWHYIERPILALRKKFSFVARVRLAEG